MPHHGPDDVISGDPAHLEAATISGAVRTDLILSAEIMTLALNDVADEPLALQAGVLVVVGLAMTAVVYGVVGLIVKMDDIGLHLARRSSRLAQGLGRGLVRGMPLVLSALTVIGTVAMLWVGGGILLHGAHTLGFAAPAEWVEHLASTAGRTVGWAGGLAAWLVEAGAATVCGLAFGGFLASSLMGLERFRRPRTT